MAKIITIAGQKGGSGKSTIAAHLAVALSQRGKKVLIIDIDPQASLKTWYQIREKTYGKGYTGIQLIESSGWRVSSSISQYSSQMDYIIIDSPPHTETETKNAIRAADLVILPMQASPTDLWATKSTIEFAEQGNKLFKILLNRYNPNSKTAKEIAKQVQTSFENTLGNRVAFGSCFLLGKCVTESDPSSQAAEEIRLLTEEIAGIFEDVSKAKEAEILEEA